MSSDFRAVIWTLGGAASFAILGGLFGALAGGFSRRNGSATGSYLGARIARAIRRLLERDLSPTQQGILIGAADGAVFLGILGALIGLIAHHSGNDPSSWLLPMFVLMVSLLAGAVVFGLLAYGMISLRVHSIFTICLGGFGGGAFTAWMWGTAHIVPGAAIGILLGAVVYYLLLRVTGK